MNQCQRLTNCAVTHVTTAPVLLLSCTCRNSPPIKQSNAACQPPPMKPPNQQANITRKELIKTNKHRDICATWPNGSHKVVGQGSLGSRAIISHAPESTVSGMDSMRPINNSGSPAALPETYVSYTTWHHLDLVLYPHGFVVTRQARDQG